MARRPERSERGALRLDPRLVIGIVLVAASTTGVWALVSGLDDSSEVYAVRDTVTPGDPHRRRRPRASSRCVSAAAADRYLVPGDVPDDGLVVDPTRSRRASSCPPRRSTTRIARGLAASWCRAGARSPRGLGSGSTVDVWAARELERGALRAAGRARRERRDRRHPGARGRWSTPAAAVASSCSSRARRSRRVLEALAARRRDRPRAARVRARR